MSDDALELLAAGLACRARVDALHVAASAPVALVTAKQPVAPVDRGNKRKRRAVTPQIGQSGRKCTVQQAPIISRGLSVESPASDYPRLEKPAVLSWLIISMWK